jgi:hypothetical protein
MKTWVKCYAFLAGLACATVALATEPMPIADRDVFEKQYIECIKEGIKNDCIVPLFMNHVTLGSKGVEDTVHKFNSALQQLIKGTNVYGVYVISKTIKAEIYDDRTYLIQWGNGSVTCFRVLFRQILGEWYMANLQLRNDNENIIKILDLKWSDATSLTVNKLTRIATHTGVNDENLGQM